MTWTEPKHQTRIEQAPDGPPSWGRWKVYIDENYRGSAPTKAAAQKLAKQIEQRTE